MTATPSSRTPTATSRLASFATTLSRADVPPDVLDAARLHLLDTLGCAVAGHALQGAPYARATIEPGTTGRCSAVGVPRGVPAADAAFTNGVLCHALDFDDTHGASIAHVSSVVVPAALATAQARGCDGEQLLLALLVGNEVTCRVGMPVGDAFHHRGFHPTAICGVFGATAAVGRLVGLSTTSMVQALGIAGSMAAGLLCFLNDGSDTKRIHPGWMAHAAHNAVALAAAGASGPADVLEGHKGVYEAFLQRSDVEVPTSDLGIRWETPRIAFKAYPACHFLHAAIEAVSELTRESLDPHAMARITVLMPQAGLDMVLSPLEMKRRPRTPYESKFSAPFAIGAQLSRGTVDVQTFTESALHDEEILAFAGMVDHQAHEYSTFPQSFPAGVRVRMRDGTEHEAHVSHQRGGPERPMQPDDVIAKFDANAATGLEPGDAARLRAALLGLEAGDDLAALAILQRVEAPRAPTDGHTRSGTHSVR